MTSPRRWTRYRTIHPALLHRTWPAKNLWTCESDRTKNPRRSRDADLLSWYHSHRPAEESLSPEGNSCTLHSRRSPDQGKYPQSICTLSSSYDRDRCLWAREWEIWKVMMEDVPSRSYRSSRATIFRWGTIWSAMTCVAKCYGWLWERAASRCWYSIHAQLEYPSPELPRSGRLTTRYASIQK